MVSAIAYPYSSSAFKRRKNTWYSIADGNWTSRNTWMCNSLRRYDFPQTGDDVYINHSVNVNSANGSAFNYILNNLYVSGKIVTDASASGKQITVQGDLQVSGTIDLTSTQTFTINLLGVNNYVNSFTGGTNSTISYNRVGYQPVMALTYRNLTIAGSGTKELTGSITPTGNLVVSSVLELGVFNLMVNGTTNYTGGTIQRTPSSTGAVFTTIGLISSGSTGTINLGATNDMESRGGISWDTNSIIARTLILSTNNQTISAASSSPRTLNVTADILVKSGITITHSSSAATGGSNLNLVGNLNAESSTSTYNLTTGTFTFTSGTSVTNRMSGGVWNFTNATASLGLVFNGDFTIPYTTVSSLILGGTGIKSLSGNTILNGNLTISAGTLECGFFNLTVTGTSSISTNGLSKNGSGALLFIGLPTSSANGVNFSGNPTIELRSGWSMSGSTGTGVLTFTTNSQSIFGSSTISNPVTISGAITVTNSNSTTFTNTVNGDNAASTLDNRSTINYLATQRPMLTGILLTNAAANTFVYSKAGDQDITGGTYRTLTLAGSGIKTLQGNVVVATLYTLTPPATLNLNGFTRT